MLKIGFVFPGQGSQCVGMGKELYTDFSVVRETFANADRVLGFSISEIILEGPEESLQRTDMAQPALLTVEVAAWRVLVSQGKVLPESCITAGHSLGEYAAWVAAGVLTFESALKIVRMRGQLMQTAAQSLPGGMAAVLGLSASEVMILCREVDAHGAIQPANYNCPGQVVVSGSLEALEQFKALAATKKIKVIPLKVSGPFHSKFMQSAGEGLADYLRQFDFQNALFPVVSNVTAKAISRVGEIPEVLVKQVSSSVRWEESVQCMVDAGVGTFIELGPGKVLRGLIKKISPPAQCYGAFSPVEIDTIFRQQLLAH